jgi:aminoglycoside phosphotransferase (APT) family kinase protein
MSAMSDAADVSHRLPRMAQNWVRKVLQADGPLRVQRLAGGWTSDMWLVRTSDARQVVLRQMTREPWRTHAVELLNREAAVQRALAPTAIPVPRPLAIDATGTAAGMPSLLMTRLEGALLLDDDGDEVLARLAAILGAIHAHRPAGHRPRPYQSWAVPAKRVPPAWAADTELWRRAFRVLERTPPEHRGVFMHRDFQLGNVLWREGRVSGVVDWVETSWGPAHLDVAHCETNLAMLHGPSAAHRFRAAYLSATATADQIQHDHAYWQVMDVVGYLPTPRKVAGPWRDKGRVDVTDSIAEQRLELWLRELMATCP